MLRSLLPGGARLHNAHEDSIVESLVAFFSARTVLASTKSVSVLTARVAFEPLCAEGFRGSHDVPLQSDPQEFGSMAVMADGR
jgi:hypothetical protein